MAGDSSQMTQIRMAFHLANDKRFLLVFSHGAHIILISVGFAMRRFIYFFLYVHVLDHLTIDKQKGAGLTGLIRRLSCFIVVWVQQNQIFSRRGP